MDRTLAVLWSFVTVLLVAMGCGNARSVDAHGQTGDHARPDTSEPSRHPACAQSGPAPRFEDYPAEVFIGTPAPVNLASHPGASMFRSALTRGDGEGPQFAGHYRVVEIGGGTACQAFWAVDLVDGTVRRLFVASYGAVFRPDSRLIVANDPREYLSMLDSTPIADVEAMMKTYGPPAFYVEERGRLMTIGSFDAGLDALRAHVTAMQQPPSSAE